MKDALNDFPMILEIRIAWGEMDSFRHVNNVAYFRYLESARVAYLDRVGAFECKDTTGVGPILASTRCRFRIPLTYPDTVSVGSRISSIGRDRFTMEHKIFSHALQKLAAEGEDVIITYDYREARKAPIPPDWQQKILEIEKNANR